MIILLVLTFFGTLNAYGSFFNPVTTIDSRTIAQNTFALSKGSMQNINSSFMMASLNYGLFQRLEIGTSPIFYFSPEHRYNYLLKTNFYRGSYFDWSLVFGENVYRVDLPNEKANLRMTAFQLAFNYHVPDEPWALGASLSKSCGYIDSKNRLTFVYSYKCVTESGLDFQYEFMPNKWLTAGYGKMRDNGFSPYEELTKGYGLAFSQFFAGKLLSRPSLGVYHQNNGNTIYLVTTTFYETR